MITTPAPRWINAPADLAPIVNSVWRWESAAPMELPLYLPGVGAECFFHHGQPPRLNGRRLPRAYLLFCTGTALRFEADGPLCFTALRIRAGRLRYLAALPPAAICDNPLPLDKVWGAAGAAVTEALTEAAPLASHATRLFDFVRQTLHERQPPGGKDAVNATLDRLYYAPNLRIQTLADDLGWSRRSLERRFAAASGLSPKRFARLARMQHVFRRVALSPGSDILGEALDIGYYDQAHFIHDVEDLTTLSPSHIVTQWRGKPTFYNRPSRLPEGALGAT
jgi:AraC-like DNA-binding protein